MEKTQSWTQVTNTGLEIRASWQTLADEHSLSIDHWGLPALTGFSFRSPNALIYKTFITQEMLKKGFLASNAVYVSTAHEESLVRNYIDALDPIFARIAMCENQLTSLEGMLEGPACHGGFKRLN
jgi:glutamate-1-semialdehyde 2,1-aminomutase